MTATFRTMDSPNRPGTAGTGADIEPRSSAIRHAQRAERLDPVPRTSGGRRARPLGRLYGDHHPGVPGPFHRG